MSKKTVYWISKPPVTCDLTGMPIGDRFVDGHLPGSSRWGCIDPKVFKDRGGKLGLGMGQLYVKQPEGQEDAGQWLKVEG
jgi:hypothetical protein